MEKDINILIVDDDLKVADLLKINLLSLGPVYVRTVGTASEALEFLVQEEYDVVISDLRMPDMDGLEFFKEMNSLSPSIVKVLLTGFGDLSSLHEDMQSLNIFHFISKPWQKAQLQILMESIFREIRNKREINLLQKELEMVISSRDNLRHQLKANLDGMMESFKSLIKLSSHTVTVHGRRTSLMVGNLATRLGKSQDFIERVQAAAFIHDMPLLAYPDHIQHGLESYMSIHEKQNYERHPEICANLLGNVDGFSELAEIVRYHHENIDGSGFYGVLGEDLSEEAKMIRICDCYDEEETYNRNAHQSTLDYMKMFKGKWFDNTLFDEFYEMMSSLKN